MEYVYLILISEVILFFYFKDEGSILWQNLVLNTLGDNFIDGVTVRIFDPFQLLFYRKFVQIR